MMISHSGHCDKCQVATIQIVCEVNATDGKKYALCRACWIPPEKIEEDLEAIQ